MSNNKQHNPNDTTSSTRGSGRDTDRQQGQSGQSLPVRSGQQGDATRTAAAIDEAGQRGGDTGNAGQNPRGSNDNRPATSASRSRDDSERPVGARVDDGSAQGSPRGDYRPDRQTAERQTSDNGSIRQSNRS